MNIFSLMQCRIILLFALYICNNAMGQMVIPTDTTRKIEKGGFSINNKSGQSIFYKEKSGYIHTVDLIKNAVLSFSSGQKNGLTLHVDLSKKNGRVMTILEVENDSAVTGPMLLFNKKGQLELILVYDNSILVNTLYYRKKIILTDYLRNHGATSPYSFGTTVVNMPGCSFNNHTEIK